MPAETSFWQMLTEVGREHDKQLSGLLNLVRDLRLELDRATNGTEILSLRSENMELKKRLSLSGHFDSPRELTDRSTVPSSHDGLLPVREELQSTGLLSLSPPATILDGSNSSTQPQHARVDQNSKPALPALPALTDPNVPMRDEHVVQTPETAAALKTLDDAAGFVNFNQPVPPALERPPPVFEQTSNTASHKVASEVSPRPKRPKPMRSSTSSLTVYTEETEGVAGFLDQNLKFVTSPYFEAFVGTLVLVNTVTMMIEAQCVGLQIGYVTGFPGIDGRIHDSWAGMSAVFLVIDHIFTTIFFFELVVRILRFRKGFFMMPLNWIDILAVLASIFQAFSEAFQMNPTIVRLLRVARPLRGVRYLKSKAVQGSLNILAKCIQASFVTLFWSLLLLMMIQCILSMVVSQVTLDFIGDLDNSEESRHQVFRYYGTFTRCLITMFEIHMANWATPCRVLIHNVSEIWGNILVFYRCVFGFALMNVIGAVFVQQAMSVQQQDHEIMMLKKRKDSERYISKLSALFHTMDTNGDGQLSRQEFDAVHDDQELKTWMESLDINPDDLQGLFDLLDTGDGFVSSEEFLVGATRVRGTARNIDVATLLVTIGKLERTMERVANITEKNADHIPACLTRLDDMEELIRETKKKQVEPPKAQGVRWVQDLADPFMPLPRESLLK